MLNMKKFVLNNCFMPQSENNSSPFTMQQLFSLLNANRKNNKKNKKPSSDCNDKKAHCKKSKKSDKNSMSETQTQSKVQKRNDDFARLNFLNCSVKKTINSNNTYSTAVAECDFVKPSKCQCDKDNQVVFSNKELSQSEEGSYYQSPYPQN